MDVDEDYIVMLYVPTLQIQLGLTEIFCLGVFTFIILTLPKIKKKVTVVNCIGWVKPKLHSSLTFL